jgi:hypothetical protein
LTIGSLGKQVETCCMRSICALVCEITRGLQWPTLIVTMPPKKSRYFLPSTSHVLHERVIHGKRIGVVSRH